jgi:hypothetical protein
MYLQQLGPKAKQAVLDEFELMPVAQVHMHKGTPAFRPEKVPGDSNPTFEWDG